MTITECEGLCAGKEWSDDYHEKNIDPIPTCNTGCKIGLEVCDDGKETTYRSTCTATERTVTCVAPKVLNTDPKTNWKDGSDCIAKKVVCVAPEVMNTVMLKCNDLKCTPPEVPNAGGTRCSTLSCNAPKVQNAAKTACVDIQCEGFYVDKNGVRFMYQTLKDDKTACELICTAPLIPNRQKTKCIKDASPSDYGCNYKTQGAVGYMNCLEENDIEDNEQVSGAPTRATPLVALLVTMAAAMFAL